MSKKWIVNAFSAIWSLGTFVSNGLTEGLTPRKLGKQKKNDHCPDEMRAR